MKLVEVAEGKIKVCAVDKRIILPHFHEGKKEKRKGRTRKMTQKKNKVSEKHFGWLLSEINGSWRHRRKENLWKSLKFFFSFLSYNDFFRFHSISLLSALLGLKDFQLMVFDLWGL